MILVSLFLSLERRSESSWIPAHPLANWIVPGYESFWPQACALWCPLEYTRIFKDDFLVTELFFCAI